MADAAEFIGPNAKDIARLLMPGPLHCLYKHMSLKLRSRRFPIGYLTQSSTSPEAKMRAKVHGDRQGQVIPGPAPSGYSARSSGISRVPGWPD